MIRWLALLALLLTLPAHAQQGLEALSVTTNANGSQTYTLSIQTLLTLIIWRYRHNINIIFFSKLVGIFIFRSPCSFYIIFKFLYHLRILCIL